MKKLAALWALLVPLFAQDYFPIQTGNEWVFRGSRLNQTRVISVGESAEFDGQTYYAVSGFPGEARWLKSAGDGSVSEYDPNTNSARTLLQFRFTEGQMFATSIDRCNPNAVIAARPKGVTVPAGTFDDVVEVRFPDPSCADAGLESDFYAANIGPIKRTETSFAGPITYELVYARVNGMYTLAQAETGFGIAVRPPTEPDGALFVRLTLKNGAPEPIRLNFTSGQIYNFVVSDLAGEVLYNWASDKLFVQQVQTIVVDKEKNWATAFPVPTGLPPGTYVIEGYLTTAERQNYRAKTEFVVPAAATPQQ